MVFLIIFLIVVGLVVFFLILDGKKNKKDIPETNQRLKEAAESGANPQSVIGYRCIEQNEVLRNSELYPMVKELCMELLKQGYQIDPHDVSNVLKHLRRGGAEFLVYGENQKYSGYGGNQKCLGKIKFWESVNRDGESYINELYSNLHIKKYEQHIIQHCPFIFIDSMTPCTEAPPEWLMICAKIVKKYILFPEVPWVSEHPEARKYVNVMFKDV